MRTEFSQHVRYELLVLTTCEICDVRPLNISFSSLIKCKKICVTRKKGCNDDKIRVGQAALESSDKRSSVTFSG